MTTYISILRGINVGGKNPIRMDALKELYLELGFHRVTTYIQSGNVVFQSELTDAGQIVRLIAENIADRFKLQVPVLIREYHELRAILSVNPFLKAAGGDISKLHITFLSALPETIRVQAILGGSYLPDEFSLKDQTIYLSCPNGYGQTKLTNGFFENKLRVMASTRNLRTLYELEKIGGLIENPLV